MFPPEQPLKYTEQDARDRALTGLRRLLDSNDAPRRIQTWTAREESTIISADVTVEMLWFKVQDLLLTEGDLSSSIHHSVVVSYLIKEGLIDLLMHLVIDFASLNNGLSLTRSMVRFLVCN